MSDRNYKCPSCGGVVAIPERRRTITLEAVRDTHERTCPGRGRRLN